MDFQDRWDKYLSMESQRNQTSMRVHYLDPRYLPNKTSVQSTSRTTTPINRNSGESDSIFYLILDGTFSIISSYFS